MRRKACALLLSAAMGGCMSAEKDMGPACTGSWGKHHGPPSVPGVSGPHGQQVAMASPYNMAPPANPYLARQMMGNSVPLNMVQINRGGNVSGMSGTPDGMMPPTPIPPGGVLTPPGVPFAPGIPSGPNVTQSGFMPGMGGPGMGGGVIPANIPPGVDVTGGLMLAQYGPPGGGPGAGPVAGPIRYSAQRTQIRFTRPTGMKVAWFAAGPDGRPTFSNVPLEAPARYNFTQGAIYKLKISGIDGRPGLEVYPTMEVVPANPKTDAFLAHSAVPIEFTQDDFKQIAEGNYVTKVIYLPDPQFQDVAGSGTDEIVSTRLEPGADPIQEALRRGSILVVIRMGNVDEEAPNTPPLTSRPAAPAQPHGPNIMVPYPGHLPKTGALPPGGPMVGAPVNPLTPPPGFNPMNPPPGFNPLVPPPGFNAGGPPTGSGLAPAPGAGLPPSILFPPPANSAAPLNGDSKLEVPNVPPTPATSDTKKSPSDAGPIVPPPAPVSGAKKTPSPTTAPVIPTVPTLDTTKTPATTAPVTPAAPTVPAVNETKKFAPITTPSVPANSGAKKIDPSVPPLPTFPNSKATDMGPMVTPASVPPLPTIPEIDGPPAVPALPPMPGTFRPAAPTSPTPNATRPSDR